MRMNSSIRASFRDGTVSMILGSIAPITIHPGGDMDTILGIPAGMADGMTPGMILGIMDGAHPGTVDGMATIPDGTEDGTDGDTVPTEAGMPTTDAVQADAAETEVFGPAADAVVAAQLPDAADAVLTVAHKASEADGAAR